MAAAGAPELETFERRGSRCEADFYAPADRDPPWPVVLLANVFGAPRAWALDRFAERFAAAGIGAFAFDYRYLGTSGGRPRRLVDPAQQLADWRAALEHVRSMDRVDPDRIALWGASFSGGHVLALAREDGDIRAVVSMVPFVDGRAVMAHQTAHLGPLERGRTFGLAVADRLLGGLGLGPLELPIVSEPHEGGLVDTPGAKAGFLSIVPEGVAVVNRMPARVVLDLPFHRPGLQAGDIQVPVHVVIAEGDRLLPIEPMERLIESLPEPSVHRVDAGHFDAMVEPLVEDVAERQVRFLAEALAVRG